MWGMLWPKAVRKSRLGFRADSLSEWFSLSTPRRTYRTVFARELTVAEESAIPLSTSARIPVAVLSAVSIPVMRSWWITDRVKPV